MILEEFQKRVDKANLYDKYWFFLLYTAFAGMGFFFLYDVIVHQAKYDRYGTRFMGYLIFIILVFLGIRGLFLVPNRYKVLSVQSLCPIDNKKQIILELIKDLGDPFCDTTDIFYSFVYKKNWWTSSYKVFLSMDSDNFYISVQSRTGGYYGGGIIDFGSTERVREMITVYLTNIIESVPDCTFSKCPAERKALTLPASLNYLKELFL